MLARQVVLLTSSESFHPTQLPSRQQSTAENPLAATLMDFPASVANKRLTSGLSPLDATLTKNRGVGSVIVNQPPLFSNVQTCLQGSFVLNCFHTLSFSVSCNSFACHSYENCRVCTNNSHSGTQAWKIAAVKVCSSSPSTSHQSRFTSHKSAHPPVPNGTGQRPLPHAYNYSGILPSSRSGGSLVPASWRSS